jgi:hypothetical protein
MVGTYRPSEQISGKHPTYGDEGAELPPDSAYARAELEIHIVEIVYQLCDRQGEEVFLAARDLDAIG